MAFHQDHTLTSGTLDAPDRYAGTKTDQPDLPKPPAQNPPSEVPGENRTPEKFPEKGAKLH